MTKKVSNIDTLAQGVFVVKLFFHQLRYNLLYSRVSPEAHPFTSAHGAALYGLALGHTHK
jgi:hypothetical protein